MKFKRLFVVLLISFMLLSVPCAYATEDVLDSNLNSFAKDSISDLDVVTSMNSPTHNKYLGHRLKQVKPMEIIEGHQKLRTISAILEKIPKEKKEAKINSYNMACYKLQLAKRFMDEVNVKGDKVNMDRFIRSIKECERYLKDLE